MDNKKNMKKYIAIGSIVGVIVLIAVILLIVILCKDEKINLNSYLNINYSGYDGYGNVDFEIDYSAITKDYAEKIGLETEREMYIFNQDLAECIDGELNKFEELGNGDEIYFKWDVDVKSLQNKYDIEISFEDVYKKVSGLEEIVAFDPFEDVVIEFTGMTKNGKAKIASKNEEYSWIEYNISKDYSLSNGDKITVEVKNNDRIQQYCIENGIEFSRIEREYTVEGLGYYFSSINDIPAAEMSKMQKQAEDAFKADVEQNWDEKGSMKGMTYLGCYLLSPKGETWSIINNYIYLIYKIDVSNSNGEFSYYYYTGFKNLHVTSEGENVVDILSYDVPYGNVDTFWGEPYISGECFIEGDYWYVGYRTLDEIFNASVTSELDEYSYESNVKE